jgi:transcriptional regulator with XRE-family HTH domain
MIPERIGQRIAALRQELGWTQQELAERLAISRVAVSHIEADISFPGERTVALLAGLFKMSPHSLVEGTTYPQAKVDRLPTMVCCYSALEVDVALLQNDVTWLEKVYGCSTYETLEQEVVGKWRQKLEEWEGEILDKRHRSLLEMARSHLIRVEGELY